MTNQCPECGTPIEAVTTAGPADHRLDPCGCPAPIEFRRKHMSRIVCDGSGIIPDPLAIDDSEPFYLVKNAGSGSKRTVCHLPSTEDEYIPRCGKRNTHEFFQKSPAICRNMGLSVCENCVTDCRPHDIYTVAKGPADTSDDNALLVQKKHGAGQRAKQHYAHTALPDRLYIPPSEQAPQISLAIVEVRPRCDANHHIEYTLVNPNVIDRELCGLCENGRAYTGEQHRMAAVLEGMDKDAIGGRT